MMIEIRRAASSDVEAINRIYNQAILAGHQTADTNPYTLEMTLHWLDKHSTGRHPIHVLTLKGEVVGWSSLSPYRAGRKALDGVAEISYYIESAYQGKGFGKKILAATIAHARELDLHTLVAILLDSNARSKGILSHFGFAEWGRIPGAAFVLDQSVDHIYFGLKL